MTSNAINDLKTLLKELFQYDYQYLDFGIYRIMNQKREEINKFIEIDLLEKVKKEIGLLNEEQEKLLIEDLNKTKDSLLGLGITDYKNNIKYKEKLEKIELNKITEIDVFNHLISFFSNYFSNGDFIFKRKYKSKDYNYVIPYNGDECLLYWSNKEQYYVKSTDFFNKYKFQIKGLNINFNAIMAEEETTNIKSSEKKYFVLSNNPYVISDNVLDIYFEYRGIPKDEKKKLGEKNVQEKINDDIIDFLFENLRTSKFKTIFEKDEGKSILELQLYNYTGRNTRDYFIHTYLEEFLSLELDFYIKNNVLKLDNILNSDENTIVLIKNKIRAIKNIAETIIQFLGQIESFKKLLWEKKKFILNTEYVITLDKLAKYSEEDIFTELLENILNNEKQLEEWSLLFGINIKNKNEIFDSQRKMSGQYILRLPIDTAYFDDDFKWRLLMALTAKADLDLLLEGIVIKSDNYHALNLILNKYSNKIKTIYIDPPYNTGSDGFLYKDMYQSSSWLTFLKNRLDLAKKLLAENGNIFVSIANNANYYKESYKLGLLLDEIFEKRFADLIWKRRSGSGSYVISDITEIHEYIFCWGKSNSEIFKNIISETKRKEYKYKDEKGIYKWHDLVIHQYTREQRPNLFYGVVYDHISNILYFNKDIKEVDSSKEIIIYPSENGKSVFTMTKESMREVSERGILKVEKEGEKYKIKIKKYLIDELGLVNGDSLKSILDENDFEYKIGGTNTATRELKNIFGDLTFVTAKPIDLILNLLYISTMKEDLVLDFFAGSGTTAQAVMKLNQIDGGMRKFILVEMADYVNTLIIPRIKKIAFSSNWNEGLPVDNNGQGIFLKYHSLEQYDDSLENIQLKQTSIYESTDYFVSYMLKNESRESSIFLNLDNLLDPYEYKLNIIRDYKKDLVKIDIIETFNYLLGITISNVKRIKTEDNIYSFIFGTLNNKQTAIIWRKVKGIDFNKDKLIIEENIKEFNPEIVYANGDAVIKNYRQIEMEFRNLMMPKAE